MRNIACSGVIRICHPDQPRRQRLGDDPRPGAEFQDRQAGRRIAEREYSAALSSEQTIAIYRELL